MRSAYPRALALRLLAVPLSTILITGPAAAADATSPAATDSAKAGWVITVGAQAQVEPSFAGAKTSSLVVLPSLDWRRAGDPETFSAPDEDFSIDLIEIGGVTLGPLAGLRSSRPDNVLRGLPGYGTDVELGGFADYWFIKDALRARLELRHGLEGGDGFTGTLGLDAVAKVGAFTFGIGPRLDFADTTTMRTQFGVTPITAALNPLLAGYDPSAGITSAGVAGSIAYRFSPEWSGTLYASYDRLVGDAADSPIVRQLDSADQFTIGIELSRSFLLR